MGFMEGFGRLMKGEPIFQAPPTSSEGGLETTHVPITPNDHSGASSSGVVPKVEVEETESHVNGHHLRITVRIVNHSATRVELDKIRLFNTRRELDTWLSPHQEKEFIVYEGQVLNHRNYDDAWIDYRDESGDYFQQYHTVEFQQESQNEFSVKYIRPSGPVKDI